MRTSVHGDPTFVELLQRARDTCLDGYRHQDLPFEVLLNELRSARGAAALFDILLILQNYPAQPVEIEGVTLRPVEVDTKTAHFPLTMTLTEHPGGIAGVAEYDVELLEAGQVDAVIRFFMRVLARMVESPHLRISSVPWLAGGERDALIAREREHVRGQPVPAVSVHQAILSQAARTPAAIALRQGDTIVTYAELARRSEAIAARLHACGVGRGDIVAIHAGRSPSWVCGMLGTLLRGAAYLPLDPDLPMARRRTICDRARPAAVLVDDDFDADLGCPAIPLAGGMDPVQRHAEPVDVDPHDLAYVLYTSGSTGVPKGVMVEHGSLAAFTAALARVLHTGPADRYLQFASLSWDTSAEEIFPCLTSGATLVLRSEAMVDPAELLRGLSTAGVTTVNLPTAFWTSLVGHLESAEAGLPASIHTVIIGGEAAHAVWLEKWFRLAPPSVRLLNSYGATEITAISTWCDLRPGLAGVPIGENLPGIATYVLDSRLEPVPPAVAGDLYVGGAGVSRGYLADPRRSAALFVPDPFAGAAGGRMYATGDRVRRRADGMLEFVGRRDRQVKVRGHRVELGEVEAALLAIDDVADAAVVAMPATLRAACVLKAGSTADETQLLARLRAGVPRFMVPDRIAVLDALPATATGKLDRRALADSLSGLGAADPSPLLGTGRPEAQMLAAIWEELLQRPVSSLDDFFELGGHSLLATQLIVRIRSVFGVDLPLRAVFDHSQLDELAGLVWSARLAGREQMPDLPLTAQPADAAAGVSFAQQRLWFLEQLTPGTPSYNMPVALHHRRALDVPRLARAMSEVVRRHAALRATFVEQDGLPLLADNPATAVRIAEVDLRELSAEARMADAWSVATTLAQDPFDLSTGPLFRICVLRLGDAEYATVFVVHHIIADAWSMRVLAAEVGELYQAEADARPARLSPLPIQYADFARWQRTRLDAAARARLEEFWRRTLSGLGPLRLPTDRVRGAISGREGATHTFAIEPALAEGLRSLTRAEGATLFVTLAAAVAVLLSRLCGRTEFGVGFPVSGRVRTELEGLIGLFVNTLVLRCDLKGAPAFRSVVRRIRERLLDALEHQDLPFDELVALNTAQRRWHQNPLFRVCVAVNSEMPGSPELAGEPIVPIGLETGAAKFDLSVTFVDRHRSLVGVLEYDRTLWDDGTVVRLADDLTGILREAVHDPDRPLGEPRATPTPEIALDVPRMAVHELVAAQTRRTPEAPAVEYEGLALTYQQLEARSDDVARALAARGAGREAPIGLRATPGIDMVVALLGILKAGCAWMAIDPQAPAARTRAMVEHAGVAFTLPDPAFERGPADPVALPRVPSDALFSVLHTSGSTGVPKAVMSQHGAVANRLEWMRRALDVGPRDRILQKTPLTFDVATWELFLPLVSGGTLVLCDPAARLDMPLLARIIARQRISIVHFVPSVLREFLDEPGLDELPVRCIVSSGEALTPTLARQVSERVGARLYNLYGPTEAAIDATWFDCEAEPVPDDGVPIGRAIANVTVHVLDTALRPVPPGVAGEIYIGGIAPARGYLGRPALTASSFVPDPAGESPGARLYRTGDRGVVAADGAVRFLGRADAQVKLRGIRVDLEEIDEHLRRHSSVRDAASALRHTAGGDLLEAFVVPMPGSVTSADALREFLRGCLPEPLVPARVHFASALPKSPHGKLDRPALLDLQPIVSREGGVAPRTEAELVLAGMWGELLGGDGFSVDDDFFQRGGHSLLMARLASRIRRTFGVDVPLADLFDGPTIAGMTVAIATAQIAELDEAEQRRVLQSLQDVGIEANERAD